MSSGKKTVYTAVTRKQVLNFVYTFCSQMDSFKEWFGLERNRKNIPVEEVPFLLNEINTHAVAIKGNNIFPVTYSLAANVSIFINVEVRRQIHYSAFKELIAFVNSNVFVCLFSCSGLP